MIPQIKYIFDRQHRASRDKKGSIELRITFERKQKYVTTGIKCFPGEWDAKAECVRSLEAQELNAILVKIRAKVMKIIGDMVDRGVIEIDKIPTLMKNDVVDMTFDTYIYKRMYSKQVSDYTKKAYHVFYSRFVEWGGMKFFSDVNERKVRDWDEYLHAFSWKVKDKYNKDVIKKYSQATIGSMHKNLKAFINDAMVDGYLRENPYIAKRIKIDKGSTRIDKFLTIEEINAIEKAEMPTLSLSEARDLFLIQVYTDRKSVV